MQPSSKGNQQKPIEGNAAFKMWQNLANTTADSGTKPIAPQSEPRGRPPTKQTGDVKVLYPSASNTTDTNAAPSDKAPAPSESRTSVNRSHSESRSRSGSPKKLVRREPSHTLRSVQQRLASDLGASPEITRAADQVLPKVTGPAVKLKLDIAAVKKATEMPKVPLSETTQPAATARARPPVREETKETKKTRSESPKKKPQPPETPGSDSVTKQRSGLFAFLEKKSTSHRKDTKASKASKASKVANKRHTEVQSPRSPEVTFQATPVQPSSPILKQVPPTPKTQESPAPVKPLPKPPLPKRPEVAEQTGSMPAPPQDMPPPAQDMPPPPQDLPEQPAEVVADTQPEMLASPTVSPREEITMSSPTTVSRPEKEKPSSKATTPRTPPDMRYRPSLRPKAPPTQPTTVPTTQTDTPKNEV